VLLLIGRFCASSNESFIAAMQQLPQVTLVGDTTGGATANPQTFMPGGGWSYTVSRWIEYTASGQKRGSFSAVSAMVRLAAVLRESPAADVTHVPLPYDCTTLA
jgi:Peptidase family S41